MPPELVKPERRTSVLPADVLAQLVESEARFRVMADFAPVMLWVSGRDGNCTFFNQGWLAFTGRTIEEEQGVGWAGGVLAEDFPRCMDVYLESFVARRSFRMEYRMRRADGVYRWVLDQGVPRFGPGGGFEGYIGSCIDVTEMKEAREAALRSAADLEQRVNDRTAELREALNEREVLMREVHHRVKNNLQLITSLFSLQARQTEGPAREVLEQAKSRVRSIGLIHEKLYGSRNLSAIDFGRYVRDLVGAIEHVSGQAAVSIELDVDDIQLGVDRAIPCGLIVNELTTNAMKHAFPGGRGGRVRVSLHRTEGERLELCVTDDGVGLPAGVDMGRHTTLGLELVFTLSRQLGARLSLERDPGTTFRLTFDDGGKP